MSRSRSAAFWVRGALVAGLVCVACAEGRAEDLEAEPKGPTTGPPPPGQQERAEDEPPPRLVDAECPGCEGSGIVKEAGCLQCKSTGHVGVDVCRSCRGTGRAALECFYCGGQGVFRVGGREIPCRGCGGKGHPPCPLCRGKGTIKRPNPAAERVPTKTCPNCEGWGLEKEGKCAPCRGTGKRRFVAQYIVPAGGGAFTEETARATFDCTACGGDGQARPICRTCQGRGYMGPNKRLVPCRSCAGTGHKLRPCRTCRGRGWVKGE